MAPAKKKKKNQNGKASPLKQPRKLTIDELMKAAEHSLSVLDPRHAVTLYSVALSKVASMSEQVDILEKRAEVHVSLQNHDEALHDYEVALACVDKQFLSFHESQDLAMGQLHLLERKAALCMYIGQLSTATNALKSYLNGIQCLQRVIDIYHHQNPQQQLENGVGAPINHEPTDMDGVISNKRQLALAYSTVAELYLTDLCFEDNAEMSCESFLEKAFQLDDQCPDAKQAMCSLRLSQSRVLEAMPFILQVYTGMRTGCQSLARLVGLSETNNAGATELVEVQQVQDLPGFEFRCQTAKLLLECASVLSESQKKEQSHECAQAAIDVLGSLLAENDEVIEVWILIGDAFAMGEATDEQRELSCHYWERAFEMLTDVHKCLLEELQEAETMEVDDAIQGQLDETCCNMDELRAKLDEARGARSDMEVYC